MICRRNIAAVLAQHLVAQNLSDEAIQRIVDEDLEYLVNWEPEPNSVHALSKADAVMAFAFGYGPEQPGVVNARRHPYHPLLHQPGESNIAIAQVIQPFHQAGMDVFAQWEVAEALLTHCGMTIPDQHIARPDGQEYLGSSGVIRKFLDQGLRSDAYTRIIVVAHRHHTYRCLKTAEKIFRDENLQKTLLVADTPAVYDPRSLQAWTTSLEDWIAYEVGVRFTTRFQKNMLDARRDSLCIE